MIVQPSICCLEVGLVVGCSRVCLQVSLDMSFGLVPGHATCQVADVSACTLFPLLLLASGRVLGLLLCLYDRTTN